MSAPAPEDLDWVRGGWMQTYTGAQFWPLSPRAEDLNVADIAHSLSLQCRYNGHVDRFYSVAEHCVLVSQAVPPEDALWGLLHDAAEAYVGDMIRPLKRSMPDFVHAENQILRVIAGEFDLPPEIPESVHEADARILLTERTELLSGTRHQWDLDLEALEPLPVQVLGHDPVTAEILWLHRLDELIA
ncbi:phosphohydrolase [Nocardioides marmoriginsengisoli]|uniref:Phosphohydrolase n=1 Tax=Nocardioides marmoriginsengisoli TaxID=661483 RepID=A0A3N0CC34_9ACTN|nr:phosphohydrolase [Nocardioides marmoriginsengisoli]RNL61002.1 phosphohydrolase [Nocardioides marmoriginsengisoli]